MLSFATSTERSDPSFFGLLFLHNLSCKEVLKKRNECLSPLPRRPFHINRTLQKLGAFSSLAPSEQAFNSKAAVGRAEAG